MQKKFCFVIFAKCSNFNKIYILQFLSYTCDQVIKNHLKHQGNPLACIICARAHPRARRAPIKTLHENAIFWWFSAYTHFYRAQRALINFPDKIDDFWLLDRMYSSNSRWVRFCWRWLSFGKKQLFFTKSGHIWPDPLRKTPRRSRGKFLSLFWSFKGESEKTYQ